MTTEEGARIIEQERRIEELEKQLKDSVQVVRCKDCRSFYEELCTETGSPVEPNDYCSYGKRRTE